MPDKQVRNRPLATTAWKPGQSGNPKGRPPSPNSIAEITRAILAETDSKGRTGSERIVRAIATIAEAGSYLHAGVLFDRAEGKPREGLDVAFETPPAGWDRPELAQERYFRDHPAELAKFLKWEKSNGRRSPT